MLVFMTTPVVPQPLDAPVRPSWSGGAWLAVIGLVVVEAVLTLAVLLFIVFGASTTCGDPATASNVRSGETALIVATCIGLAPWVSAMFFSRRRLLIGALGLLSVAPLVAGMVAGLDRQFWVGSFCF
jgi:hypothetical protein